jgi:hypothetical protein
MKLEQLAARLLAVKKAERAATAERIRVEQEIINLTGLPDEGSKTQDAGRYKVTITQRINRSLDDRAWALVADKFPDAVKPVMFVPVAKIDPVGVRWLRQNKPDLFRFLATALTEKPAKPAVVVEVVA